MAAQLRRMEATLASPWRYMEGKPPLMMTHSRPCPGANRRIRMGRVPPRPLLKSRIRKLTAWLMMVAKAAPPTPMSRPKMVRPYHCRVGKMKNGSRSIFKMPPAVMPIMA